MSKKYSVFGVVGASTMTFNCEAEDVDEALEKFWDSGKSTPSVCHQCSNEVELGEVYETVVLDEDGNEVYNDQTLTYRRCIIDELLKSDKTKEEIRKELGVVDD